MSVKCKKNLGSLKVEKKPETKDMKSTWPGFLKNPLGFLYPSLLISKKYLNKGLKMILKEKKEVSKRYFIFLLELYMTLFMLIK
jgi:hypothetical protein